MKRLLLLLVAASFVVHAKPPKLALFISVDSFGSDALQRHRPRFKGGLAKLLNEGAVYPEARYETIECVTAIGHTTLATGAYAHRHGIVGNKHFNRATGKLEAPFSDASHPVLDAPPGNDDVSPVNLLAETVSDRVRAGTNFKGKALALSGKGRSSIAMAGRLGEAWWFHSTTGRFVTGTYYRKEAPAWVKAFNDKRQADAAHGKRWELLAPVKDYTGDDDRPFESELHGMSRVFPHTLTGGLPSPGPEFYSAFSTSPFATELLAEFAKAAIDGEQLGKDDVVDLLSLSFSAVDRTYHLYGPTSWEYQDHLLRFDKVLGDLIAHAEKAAGKGNVLVVLSGDHGGANVPEEWASQGLPGVRLNPDALKPQLNAALEKQLGVANAVAAIEESDVYLSYPAIEAKKADVKAVRRAAAAWLAAQAGIFAATTSDELNITSLEKETRNAHFKGRSGDVVFVTQPFTVLESWPKGTSHGQPWSYDANVPLLLWGKGVKAGHYGQQAHPVDAAPTLSALLELNAPSSSEGRVLFEAITLSK